MNVEHIQWIVREGSCYSLMRAGRSLISGLVTRPIAGVDWTVDTALVSRSDKSKPALSLLIEELVKQSKQTNDVSDVRSSLASPDSALSKPARRASVPGQLALFAGQIDRGASTPSTKAI